MHTPHATVVCTHGLDPLITPTPSQPPSPHYPHPLLRPAPSTDTSHTFNATQNDWGFNQFLINADVRNNGFLVNDTLQIKVIIRTTHYEPYNSKKETGFVGLKNQGATCYMNSLLQTLYNINRLRQVCVGCGGGGWWWYICLNSTQLAHAHTVLCMCTQCALYAHVHMLGCSTQNACLPSRHILHIHTCFSSAHILF